MKLGILTFHCAHNYGAVLQAYALKHYLSSLGCEVHIIDYQPDYLMSEYQRSLLKYWICKNPIKMLKLWVNEPFLYKDRKRRRDVFISFINNELQPDSVTNITDYDFVIYGSDQIWNPKITGGKKDLMYWGGFAPQKSISYAASLGEYSPEGNERNEVKELLKNFNAISVREQKAKDILQSLSNNEIHVVCDPVFLLSKEKWENVLSVNIRDKKPYILCYNLTQNTECMRQAQIIGKAKGLDVVEVYGEVKYHSGERHIENGLGPFDLVSHISNAAFVVTSSFHGCAFSLLLQKPFYAIGFNQRSERVRSLLSIAGIPERLLIKASEEWDDTLAYNQIEANLDAFVSKSKKFIEKALF